MRRIAVLLLLLMMTALFCGCSDPDEDSSFDTPGESSSTDDGWTPPIK